MVTRGSTRFARRFPATFVISYRDPGERSGGDVQGELEERRVLAVVVASRCVRPTSSPRLRSCSRASCSWAATSRPGGSRERAPPRSADTYVRETTISKIITVKEHGRTIVKRVPVVVRKDDRPVDAPRGRPSVDTRVVTTPGGLRYVTKKVVRYVPVVQAHRARERQDDDAHRDAARPDGEDARRMS